jgi:hypothetical protein
MKRRLSIKVVHASWCLAIASLLSLEAQRVLILWKNCGLAARKDSN